VQCGTFSITNFGSFGSVIAPPIVNQPQVAILASFCRKTIESKMSYIDFQDTLPLLCVSFRKMNLYGGWVKPWRSILGGFLRPDRAGFAENAWELA
jgi:hypothetical protein